MLALRGVLEASLQRWNRLEGPKTRKEKKWTVTCVLVIQQSLHVCWDGGGGGEVGGLKPAQVSTGMRNSGGQMSDASFLIKCLPQKQQVGPTERALL